MFAIITPQFIVHWILLLNYLLPQRNITINLGGNNTRLVISYVCYSVAFASDTLTIVLLVSMFCKPKTNNRNEGFGHTDDEHELSALGHEFIIYYWKVWLTNRKIHRTRAKEFKDILNIEYYLRNVHWQTEMIIRFKIFFAILTHEVLFCQNTSTWANV